MRIFTDIESLPVFRKPVVTVGSFDGVHLGHRHLLDVLRSRSRLVGGESVVVTFDHHPRQVLDSEDAVVLLTTPEEKASLLAAAGVDNMIVLSFDEAVSRMSPEEFVRDVLVGRIGIRELVVGYNHRLGHGRSGDGDVLEALGGKYGFGVYRASQFAEGDEKISSTAIRQAIARGDMNAAERMLGRRIEDAGTAE